MRLSTELVCDPRISEPKDVSPGHGWNCSRTRLRCALINGQPTTFTICAVSGESDCPKSRQGEVEFDGWVTAISETDFHLANGFAGFSDESSEKQSVLDYIANQEEHHRKVSFKEEFIAFLQKHEIEYDEKYLWE